MKENKKGFTLVELLAVIIVLAILVLLAMPRVINMMEKARINSFVVEANEIQKVAQTAYNDGLVGGEAAEVTVCYTVDELIKKGYLDKAKGDIRGVVVLDTVSETNDINIYSLLSKQGYYIRNLSGTSKMSKDDVISNDGTLMYNDCTSSCTATAGGTSIKCGNNEISTRTSGADVPAEVCEIENEIMTFSYTGNIQEFTILCPGAYQLEVWGAQGGSADVDGGKGGYSSGTIILGVNHKLYIGVGGAGSRAEHNGAADGGYNGGGDRYASSDACGSGGGATHIALDNNLGELKNYNNNRDDILIVAGGGGGSQMSYVGGVGGGLSGGKNSVGSGSGGSQASGYEFGLGQPLTGGGGGGGWYGGTNLGGGSGYIGGVTDGQTIAGNASMPNHEGTGTMTGNSGNGYAKITYLGE